MQTFYNYLFPMMIYKLDKTLIIADRRPTQDLLFFGFSGFGLIVCCELKKLKIKFGKRSF